MSGDQNFVSKMAISQATADTGVGALKWDDFYVESVHITGGQEGANTSCIEGVIKLKPASEPGKPPPDFSKIDSKCVSKAVDFAPNSQAATQEIKLTSTKDDQPLLNATFSSCVMTRPNKDAEVHFIAGFAEGKVGTQPFVQWDTDKPSPGPPGQADIDASKA